MKKQIDDEGFVVGFNWKKTTFPEIEALVSAGKNPSVMLSDPGAGRVERSAHNCVNRAYANCDEYKNSSGSNWLVSRFESEEPTAIIPRTVPGVPFRQIVEMEKNAECIEIKVRGEFIYESRSINDAEILNLATVLLPVPIDGMFPEVREIEVRSIVRCDRGDFRTSNVRTLAVYVRSGRWQIMTAEQKKQYELFEDARIQAWTAYCAGVVGCFAGARLNKLAFALGLQKKSVKYEELVPFPEWLAAECR